MAFTTLATAPGLRASERRHLRAMSPGRVFAHAGYASMLRQAGFTVLSERDLTRELRSTLEKWTAAYDRHRSALTRHSGAAAVEGAVTWYGDRLRAVREGLIRRMMYLAER